MTAQLPEITAPVQPRSDSVGMTHPADVSDDGELAPTGGLEGASGGTSNPGSTLAVIEAANEKFEFLKADSQWNVSKAETETEFAADTRYEDLPDRYELALRARRDDIAAAIVDPRARENFTLKAENDIALSARTARVRARQLNVQEQLRWLDEQQEK
jgi:hypothetical protein